MDNEMRVVNLLKRNRYSYYTPIYLAILNSHEKVTDLLIENGTDIESYLGLWASPLQATVQFGQLLAVRQLSVRGSDIEKPVPYKGRRTFHITCLEGNDMIV